MALYPGSENERRVPHDVLSAGLRSVFAACGMSHEDAATVADSLVDADLRGIHSHGVLRVPDYIYKLRDGGVDPGGRPSVASEDGGAIVVDGGNAMGQVVARYAMEQAIRAARDVHVAIAAARGSNHCGALDRWALMAVEEGQIGIAATNALPTMAPWGGVDKIVGINPLAIAVPGGRRPPLVMDFAFGATAHGKIRVYAQKGEAIPDHWAFDAEGRATTDPHAAMEGLIQPIGGHKGVVLGIMTGVLSAALSGASYGTELGNMVDGPRAGADGHFFMAIDVEAFRPLLDFRAEIDRISDEILESRRKEGVERLFTPGLIEHEISERYREEGIPLNEETLSGIRKAAAELGVDLDEAI